MRKRHYFSTPCTRLSTNIYEILMNELRKKCEKPPFFSKMANFGQFLAKMDKTAIFFKKALETFFSHLQALTNCKVSEKSNERFSSNSVTYGRTHARTHGRESLGLQRLRRETKNAWKNDIFDSFWHDFLNTKVYEIGESGPAGSNFGKTYLENRIFDTL